MRINHNLSSMNTYRQLSMNNANGAKSMEKLSSGLRINRAADDAAGLAISEKMRAQIRGLDQASRNAQDGVSLIQTAEGALNETHSILQRMRELAVQSSNDTNTADDRKEIQTEINQLTNEIDRIAETTTFNTKKVISGGIGAKASIDSTANVALIDKATVIDPQLKTGDYTFTVTIDTAAAISGDTDAGTGITGVTNTTPADHDLGNYQLNVTDDPENSGKKLLTLVNSDTGEEVASLNNQAAPAAATNYVIAGFTFASAATGLTNGSYSFSLDADITVAVTSGATTVATQSVDNWTKGSLNVGGVELEFNSDITAGATNITIVNNAIQFQVGADQGQKIDLAINEMSANSLGVKNLDVTSATGAASAITSIDDAIKKVSSERSKLGAVQNRLEYTVNNLNTSSENLTAAESRIRDVDMAKEVMTNSKNNILAQAAQAMLAQANQAPQGVLQLLRG